MSKNPGWPRISSDPPHASEPLNQNQPDSARFLEPSTSDAGALLLRDVDGAIGLFDRVAACFIDGRNPDLTVHSLRTLVGQRIAAIALGYEDVDDHDTLRHDPVLALLSERLTPKREDCAVLAGKSTLNRLELSRIGEPTRYHKVACDASAMEALFVDLFLDAFGLMHWKASSFD